MHMPEAKKDIINRLRQELLRWEGYKPAQEGLIPKMGLGEIEAAFPNGVFPLGTVHELVCDNTEEASAASGLLAFCSNK